MIRQNNQENIEFTEIANGLNENILQADPLRESGLQNLLKIRKAKVTGQTRELERLSKKLGEKHSRVTALSNKMEAEQILIREVAVNIERSQTETPIIVENTWVLHGRIYSKEMIGIPKLTVGLYNSKGKWLEPFGYACTDKTGYFRLNHEFAAKRSTGSTESIPDNVASKVRLPKVFIRLQDKTGTQVYIEKQAVIPVSDQIDYREIILDDNSDTCTPPKQSNKPPTSSK